MKRVICFDDLAHHRSGAGEHIAEARMETLVQSLKAL